MNKKEGGVFLNHEDMQEFYEVCICANVLYALIAPFMYAIGF